MRRYRAPQFYVCSATLSPARVKRSWQLVIRNLGQVAAKAWFRSGGSNELQLPPPPSLRDAQPSPGDFPPLSEVELAGNCSRVTREAFFFAGAPLGPGPPRQLSSRGRARVVRHRHAPTSKLSSTPGRAAREIRVSSRAWRTSAAGRSSCRQET